MTAADLLKQINNTQKCVILTEYNNRLENRLKPKKKVERTEAEQAEIDAKSALRKAEWNAKTEAEKAQIRTDRALKKQAYNDRLVWAGLDKDSIV